MNEKELLKYVKFDEKEARLFKIEENSFAITYFDVLSVANYYGTEDISEALERICEAHEVSIDDIEITMEYFDTIEGIDRAIRAHKENLRMFERAGNRTRAGIIKVAIANLEKRRAELLKKTEQKRQEARN